MRQAITVFFTALCRLFNVIDIFLQGAEAFARWFKGEGEVWEAETSVKRAERYAELAEKKKALAIDVEAREIENSSSS